MGTNPHAAVARVMSWPVATIDHDATLEEAAEALAADNIGVLLVTRDDAMVGIVSERDVVTHLAAGTHLNRLLVGEAMAGDEAVPQHGQVAYVGLIAGMVSVRDLVTVLADAVDSDVVVVPSGTRVVVTGA